jgi:amidophosphoribosyltransferase
MLQHRGQDSAGIVCYDGQRFRECKVRRLRSRFAQHMRVVLTSSMSACALPVAQDNGLVKDVFDKVSMKQLGDGSLGLGHVRYPTAGSSTAQEAQPFFVNSPLGSYLVCCSPPAAALAASKRSCT